MRLTGALVTRVEHRVSNVGGCTTIGNTRETANNQCWGCWYVRPDVGALVTRELLMWVSVGRCICALL